MRKILLISSGHSFFKGALWGGYDYEIPLNVAYTASFLESKGFEVDVIDTQILKDAQKILNEIDYTSYIAIGINSELSTTYDAYELIGFMKFKTSRTPIFAFGVFTVLKEILLKECVYLDYVIYGEEEHSCHELVSALELHGNINKIKGLIFRKGSEIVKNKPHECEKNLDSLPFPARSKFDLEKYYPSPGKYFKLPQFSILTSRGCNGQCFFCSNLRGKEMRYRSPKNIVDEIDLLQNTYNAKEVFFIDDNFTADRVRVMEFVRLMKKRDRKIFIRVISRVDTVDKEMLQQLKEIGLYSIGYGVESGDNNILSFNNKKITLDQVEYAVNIAKELNIETRCFFMLNLPGDTQATTEKTFRFIKKIRPDLVNIQITYPWPGTAMREYVKLNFKINEELWNDWEASSGDAVTFLQSDLTESYIKNMYKKIIRNHYIRFGFILNWLFRLKSFHDLKYSFLQFCSLIKKTVMPG
ncbi:B12-binding domain-containing radical SAM protein [Desulfobacula toluolica]|uniref:Radical SAM domain protein n=1 Tax=Desulfobacula toluolica (strain DSM 7467 / Tol2) TaxID=651182 RepID=K0NNQ8_DESTT|nr:radical SAM protein [Desulfobacula toluolica]CCK81678.1 radical SAM domain protein [Desulfobacula toluolica Tol2]